MPQSRRDDLQNVSLQETTHIGLWLDKYYDASLEERKCGSEKCQPGQELVKQVSSISFPRSYLFFYERWREQLKNLGARLQVANARGRLAIGLGMESVLETSIALHRTYGVPYIPGSALKGLAASFAHQHLEGDGWRKGHEDHIILFGDTKNAGFVTFFDALYIPRSGKRGKPLWPDIITVHHPDYYSEGNNPPADWDSPTPIPFLTATGKYLIALAGPDEWVETAFEILGLALAQEGIGAKTNSGYGRMVMEGYAPTKGNGQSNAAGKSSSPTPEDLPKHKGIIAKFYPNTGKGMIKDVETEIAYPFHRSAFVHGQDLPRKQKIYFTVHPDTSEVVTIKKRYE